MKKPTSPAGRALYAENVLFFIVVKYAVVFA